MPASVEQGTRPAPCRVAPTITIGYQGSEHVPVRGSRIAILGSSGSGTTRLLHTVAGLRDDASPRILVDGQDMPRAGQCRLGAAFALVPREPMPIAGTVIDNRRLARAGITEERAWQALEVACLAEEIIPTCDETGSSQLGISPRGA